MSETKKFNQMFEYHRDAAHPVESAGGFVFGRYDTRLVRKMGELTARGLAPYFLITGGLGKDSGYLWDLQIPEAKYLAAVAASDEFRIPSHMLHTETMARNGGENARLGLQLILERELPHDELTVIAHATSLRRLAATLETEAAKVTQVNKINRVPTDYPFDPTNPHDQYEAAGELIRLADWPEKGWSTPQPDLPHDLVEFARSVQKPE